MSIASERVRKRDKRREELCDTLEMFASQLRESLNGGGSPPMSWRLDDWLVEYRDAYSHPLREGSSDNHK